MAALDCERTYIYKAEIASSEPSSDSVDLLGERWQSVRYQQARKLAKWRILRGTGNGED
jgi:hypothetical protein